MSSQKQHWRRGDDETKLPTPGDQIDDREVRQETYSVTIFAFFPVCELEITGARDDGQPVFPLGVNRSHRVPAFNYEPYLFSNVSRSREISGGFESHNHKSSLDDGPTTGSRGGAPQPWYNKSAVDIHNRIISPIPPGCAGETHSLRHNFTTGQADRARILLSVGESEK